MLPILATMAHASECAVATRGADLAAALDGAEAAWGVDEAAFTASTATARIALRCLGTQIDPALAARTHRVEGLAAFLAGDAAGTRSAFAAARALDPGYRFPITMIPEGNPASVAFEAAVADPATAEVPPAAGRGATWFDGTPSRLRPTSRPTVFQHVDASGRVDTTAWVAPDSALPPYRQRGAGWRLPLLIGTGVVAAGATTLYALAEVENDAYLAATTESEADERRARVNAYAGASAGVAVTGLGVGASAFLVGRW